MLPVCGRELERLLLSAWRSLILARHTISMAPASREAPSASVLASGRGGLLEDRCGPFGDKLLLRLGEGDKAFRRDCMPFAVVSFLPSCGAVSSFSLASLREIPVFSASFSLMVHMLGFTG